jgi:hypothetical protein
VHKRERIVGVVGGGERSTWELGCSRLTVDLAEADASGGACAFFVNFSSLGLAFALTDPDEFSESIRDRNEDSQRRGQR